MANYDLISIYLTWSGICVVFVPLCIQSGCINMNPPLDFIGSIKGMKLWASILVREAERGKARNRGRSNAGSRDMAEGQGR